MYPLNYTIEGKIRTWKILMLAKIKAKLLNDMTKPVWFRKYAQKNIGEINIKML